MAENAYTYSDVAQHNTKKDLFMVIHDKVYDASKFVDEHPGGEEVLLDVGGQDATEAFEDVGHSDEARETLEQLLVGTLKRQPGDPEPLSSHAPTTPTAANASSGFGTGVYAFVLLAGLAAFGAHQYLQNKQTKQD